MTLILWIARECSERSRFGLSIKMKKAYMCIHLPIYCTAGVRDTTDVMEKYRKGALGALPDPELINSLLSIKGDVRGDDADAK